MKQEKIETFCITNCVFEKCPYHKVHAEQGDKLDYLFGKDFCPMKLKKSKPKKDEKEVINRPLGEIKPIEEL